MKVTNTVADILNTGIVKVETPGGILPLPLNGKFEGEPGPPGAGVPAGGEPLQMLRKTASGATTEWVAPTRSVVGLGNVDNTADADKPLSKVAAEALAGKADKVELDAKASTEDLLTVVNGLEEKADIVEGKIPVSQVDFAPVTPTNGARPVGKGELTIDARDYGAVGDGTADDAPAVQRAINAAVAAGEPEVLLMARTYRFDSTVTAASNLTIRGVRATINISGNRPAFIVPAGSVNVAFTGVRFVGTMPANDIATIQNQVAIKAYAAWNNVIDGFEISGCKFERVQGSAIQLQHVRNFRIRNNEIRKHGYAAIGCHSVRYGVIEGNDVEGTRNFPAFVANSYGIYVSTLEADGPVGTEQNPRSSDVMVRNNRIRKQVWSCLDTHVGERISFVGNHIEDSPASAINAVYISMTVGDPNAQLAPKDILIEGNTITYPSLLEPAASMTMAILLRGSVSTDSIATRERATGIIRGNIIRRYGRQDTSTSGAIFVGSALGVVVEGNTLNECRSIGVHVRDSRGIVVNGNTFIDLWRSSSTATAVFFGLDYDTEMDATVTGNRFVRGLLTEATGLPVGGVVNNSAINGTNSAGISVIEGNNEWGTATFATAHTRYQVGTGRLRRMSASAAPTAGTWLTGEQVVNSAPAPGGYMGWVCTTNGTPGVWKGYGLIAA